MTNYEDQQSVIQNYDTQVIRPEVRDEQIKLRGEGVDKKTLKQIKCGLLTLHCLEVMATNVYRYQATKEKSELNRELIAAMLNEMVHIQDFQVKLLEYGWRPSILAYFFYVVGAVIGIVTKLGGEKWIRKTGAWVEHKAVSHYQELLETIDWDEDTRKVIEKNWADEFHHIQVWTK